MVTTMYRALVKNGVCNPVNSVPATITVEPASEAGSVTGNATVCSGSNSGLLTLTGYTGAIQGWESSIDAGATWTAIANNTDTLSYTNLTDTTWFRAIVTSGTVCGADTSSPAVITVDPATMGGNITGTDTVCAGANGDTLMLTSYTGAILGWEFSTDGGSSWIPTTNTSSMLVYNNLSQSRWYRVKVKSGVCNMMYSDTAWIMVDPIVNAGTVTGGATVCSGSNNGLLTLSGYTGAVQSWESSTDGLTWTAIVNTTDTIGYTNLMDTTWYRAIVTSGACGADTSSATAVIVDPATVGGNIAGTDTVCAAMNGDTLMLTNYTGTILGWEFSSDGGSTWIPTTNTSNMLVYTNLTQSRWYRVKVRSGVCNEMYSDTAWIMVDPVTVGGTVSGSTAACEGASGTLMLSGHTGAVQYWESSVDGGATWTNIANTTTSQAYTGLTDTTWYRAVVMSGACAADTSSIAMITIYPKPVAAFTAPNVCEGTATVFSNTSSVSSGSITFNMWDFGNGDVSINTNPVYTYSSTGTYTVTLIVTSSFNCTDTATMAVTVSPLPSSVITSSAGAQFCADDSTMLSAPAGINYAYLWNTGDTLQTILVDSSGTYAVTVTDTVSGCFSTDSITITVNPLPVANAGLDSTIALGSSIVLNGLGGVSYSWSPITGLDNSFIANPVATPLVTTDYILTVTNANGCTDMDTVKITVESDFNFMVANMVTPNGDGYNDTWYVENIELYPDNEVAIFDRNGQEVFRTTSYANTWDGTYSGSSVPDGTYYYVIKFNDTGKTLKGSVTILRSQQ